MALRGNVHSREHQLQGRGRLGGDQTDRAKLFRCLKLVEVAP